jgi:peptidoglycan/xylan/chitin deacetylase (PgdA/CDA1 family)
VLRFFRGAVLSGLRAGGIFRLAARSSWRGRRLLILCYHGVSLGDEHEWSPGLFFSPQRFESRLRRLREGHCVVLGLAEALRRLYEGSLPARSVALTFDDGLYDFHEVAFPLLEKYGLPATVYWSTYYSGYQRPVFPVACSYILWKGRSRRVESLEEFGVTWRPDLGTPEGRRRIHLAILAMTQRDRLSAEDKDDPLSRLADRLEFDYGAFCDKRILQLMTPDEAAGLATKGVDFQLHTHRHRVPREEELFRKEIRDNREFVRAATGREASHFCYPGGDYDQRLLPWLRAEGIASATTCDPRLASPSDSPLLLPRYVDTMIQAEVDFESWLCGAKDLLVRLAGHGPAGRNREDIEA